MANISITAAEVFKGSASVIQRLNAAAATTITAGSVLYLTALGTLGLADSNGVSPANSVIGIALNGGGAGQPIDYVAIDVALTLGASAALTSGAVLYLSNTAGAITATYADVASGSTVICLGVVNTATATINFNPTVGGTK